MSDKFTVHSPTPSEYNTHAGADKIAIVSSDEAPRPPRVEPPPLPPKTPIPDGFVGGGRQRPPVPLPYPLEDGPPPAVNMARKPEYKGR